MSDITGGIKNIRNSSLEFFQNEDIKRYLKEMIKPIVNIIYNEIYVYILFICMYNVFLFFITLANLFILLKISIYLLFYLDFLFCLFS